MQSRRGEKAINSYEKAITIARACLEKKAEDVKILDIRKISSISDFFVICSASSTRRTETIKDAVDQKLRLNNCRVWHEEGRSPGTWIILDYSDVIVHIFHEQVRKFYNLDRLWGDADLVMLNDK